MMAVSVEIAYTFQIKKYQKTAKLSPKTQQ